MRYTVKEYTDDTGKRVGWALVDTKDGFVLDVYPTKRQANLLATCYNQEQAVTL